MDNDRIDLPSEQESFEMTKRQKYLDIHKKNYAIYQGQGKDTAWFTYLPLDFGKRKKVRRVNKKDLEDIIVDFYQKRESNPTIVTLFSRWNDERLHDNEISGNSHTKYANDFKRFFQEGDDICILPISEVKEADLIRFIKQNINRYNLSRKSYSSLRTLIIGVFKYAKTEMMTTLSISSFFKDLSLSKNLFKRKEKTDHEEVFTDSESKALTDYFREHPTVHNLGLLLMFETGMRVGEMCVLKPENIFPDGIMVKATEVYYKDEHNKYVYEIKNSPKGGASDRLIAVPPQTQAIIKRLRLMNPEGEYLFMNHGKRIHGIRFNYWLYKACDELNIPRRSTHKIRKTYASTLIDANIENSIIKHQMGHSDIKTTYDHYYRDRTTSEYKTEQISKAITI